MISAAMLGLGRALGETIAVAMVLSVEQHRDLQRHQQRQPEHDRRQHRAAVPGVDRTRGQRLIATGLVLFVVTLLINIARALHRSAARTFSGAN